jgi:5-formyltetrahydrofolate cyclo-ligase
MTDSRQALRQNLKARRVDLAPPPLAWLVASIAQFELPERASIASHCARHDEFPTAALNQHLLSLDHAIALPRIVGLHPPEMAFHRITPHSALTANSFGIAEPSREAPICSHFDLMLLPLLGVDRRGNRLGQGLGFYDRYLQHYRDLQLQLPIRVGLAWSVQLLDALAPEPWDIPVDWVLTEHELIRCR